MLKLPRIVPTFGARQDGGIVLFGVLTALGLILGGCSGPQVSDKDLDSLSTVEVNALVTSAASKPDSVVLIDARSPVQYERAHLPGAINLDLAEFDAVRPDDPRIARFDRKVVYGQNPGSAIARALAKRLLAVGYEGVRLYQPGIEGWTRAGLPLETDLEPDDDPASGD